MTPHTVTSSVRTYVTLCLVASNRHAVRGALVLLSVACVMQIACRPDTSEDPDPWELGDMSVAVDMPSPKEDAGSEDMGQGTDTVDAAPDEDLGVADMMRADMTLPPDMESAEDMGEEDMAPIVPLREVVERRLMGEMPMENYVKDPQFATLYLEYNWLVTNRRGDQFVTTYRHVPSKTPRGGAALYVPKSGGDAVTLYGEIIYDTSRALELSVWIGRKGGSFGTVSSPPAVYATGLDLTDLNNFSGVELTAVEGSRESIDDYTWTRYSATFQGLAGYGYLIISDDSSQDLYMHAPELTEVQPSPTGFVRREEIQIMGDEMARKTSRIYEYVREKRSTPPPSLLNDGPTPFPFLRSDGPTPFPF